MFRNQLPVTGRYTCGQVPGGRGEKRVLGGAGSEAAAAGVTGLQRDWVGCVSHAVLGSCTPGVFKGSWFKTVEVLVCIIYLFNYYCKEISL